MKIGLLDIDTAPAWPNLALMKLSAWHKRIGDTVEWYDPLMSDFHKVYLSRIFPDSPDFPYPIPCELESGGTGLSLSRVLPDPVESVRDPDYSIYPQCSFTVQMFSRGCIRKCGWCVVPEKEGRIRSVLPLAPNPRGEWVEVLDNNFFANPEWDQSIHWLINHGKPVVFHGVDARTVDEAEAKALLRLNHKKQIHIAWDDATVDMREHFSRMIEYIPKSKLMAYVLVGYDSTHECNEWRVREIHKLGMTPYVMPFNRGDLYQKRFQKWVNGHAFKNIKWKSFCDKTTDSIANKRSE